MMCHALLGVGKYDGAEHNAIPVVERPREEDN